MIGGLIKTGTQLSHAYIIDSANADVREKAALELSCAFVCADREQAPCMECRQCKMALQKIHPDVIFVDRLTDDRGKQKRELLVDQIRHMAADAWVRPQQAAKKVYILREAGLMNDAAQNAALKILEEPPVHCGFILCADSKQELLATIRSRCVTLSPFGERDNLQNADAERYVALAAKEDAAALCTFCVECEAMDGESLSQMLEAVGFRLGEILCGREQNPGLTGSKILRLLELKERAAEYLRMNVSVKHVLGMLCVLTI